MTAATSQAEDEIRASDVEDALGRALNSEYFTQTSQLTEFLSFVVARKLAGEEDQIKAYTIAVDALGYPEDFDPQTNAAVRVMAGRLRKTLALYNTTQEAKAAPVTISLESGSYVPVFERKVLEEAPPPEPAAAPAAAAETQLPASTAVPAPAAGGYSRYVYGLVIALAALLFSLGLAYQNGLLGDRQAPAPPLSAADLNRKPAISASLVLTDESYPDWFNPGAFAASIGDIIARFSDYRFVGITERKRPADPGSLAGDYHLVTTASRQKEGVRLLGQVIRLSDNTVIWSGQKSFDTLETMNEAYFLGFSQKTMSMLGSPYGVIYSDLLKQKKLRPDLDCLIAGYRYFNRETDEKHQVARRCAEELIERGSKLPSIYAMLTFLILEEFRDGRNPRKRDPMRAARAIATQAVELGPADARAHQALLAVNKVQQQYDLARASGKKAIELNPFDTDIAGDYAAWLISVGEFDEGLALIQTVDQLIDAKPAWLEFFTYLGNELAENAAAADAVAANMDFERSPLSAVAVIISAHRQGKTALANEAIASLTKSYPEFVRDPSANFAKRGFKPEVVAKIVEKLANAGLKLDENAYTNG